MSEKMTGAREEYRRAVAAVSDPDVWRRWLREADLAGLIRQMRAKPRRSRDLFEGYA